MLLIVTFNIILMNFQNFFNPFVPLHPFFNTTFYSYPQFSYPPPPLISLEAEELPSQKPHIQTTSRELNREKLVQTLQKFHFQETHHKKTHWTFQEDKLLERLVEIQKMEWREIPRFFDGRTQNMCYSRYRRILMSNKERNWSKEQEQELVELINRYGQKWKLISFKMSKFTSKQIRERYLNYLRPNINKNDYTFEEDLKICEFVIDNGNHWRQMEEMLDGRPEGSIKGRYYGRLQKIIESSYVQKRT